jgi:hypothetical protein
MDKWTKSEKKLRDQIVFGLIGHQTYKNNKLIYL